MVEYVATVGLNWEQGGRDVRAEPGDMVPAPVIKRSPWLVERGYVVRSGTGSDEPGEDGQ